MFKYHLYHYVSPCRKCGSWRTGYYINGRLSEIWILKHALRKGEYVMTFNGNLKEHNCYCMDCGIEWYEDIEPIIITTAQLKEQKRLRGIGDAIDSLNSYEKEEIKKEKYLKKQEKQHKKDNRFYKKILRKIKRKDE